MLGVVESLKELKSGNELLKDSTIRKDIQKIRDHIKEYNNKKREITGGIVNKNSD